MKLRVDTSDPKIGRWAAAGYLLFFAFGSAGHYLAGTRDLMMSATPYFLLIFGISAMAALLLETAAQRRLAGSVLWILATYVVTFLLEAIGVSTGSVFGAYLYGPTLGAAVLGVPLIIGFNWVLVVLGAALLSSRVTSRPVFASLVTATMAVVFDAVLEPVAMGLDYWQWHDGIIPLQNYAAWFAIAFLAAYAFHRGKFAVTGTVPVAYLAGQFLFMLSLLPLALGG